MLNIIIAILWAFLLAEKYCPEGDITMCVIGGVLIGMNLLIGLNRIFEERW